MSIVENIFIIVFSVLWILAYIVMLVLGILVIIKEIKEKKEKARNKSAQLDCGRCKFFALREDVAQERKNRLEENGATEKKEKVDADLDFQLGRIIGKMEEEIECAVDNQTAYENAKAEFEFAKEDFRSARAKLRIAAEKAGVPFPPALDEEKPFWEKKEYEDVRIELSEDEQEQDEPAPESEVAE